MWLWDIAFGVFIYGTLLREVWELSPPPSGGHWPTIPTHPPLPYLPIAPRLVVVFIDGLSQESVKATFQERRKDEKSLFLERVVTVKGQVVSGEDSSGWGFTGAKIASMSGAVWPSPYLNIRSIPPGEPDTLLKNAISIEGSENITAPIEKAVSVFCSFRELLKELSSANDRDKIHSQQLVFFLHLTGLSTAGKGSSVRILGSHLLLEIDVQLELLEQELYRFYQDNKTLFVIISGDNLPAPLFIWGPGTLQGEPEIKPENIAPLLASSIGAPIPAHSIGEVPSGILKFTDSEWANILLGNAMQLASYAEALRPSYLPFFSDPLPADKAKELEKNTTCRINEHNFNCSLRYSSALIGYSKTAIQLYSRCFAMLTLPLMIVTLVGCVLAQFLRILVIYLEETRVVTPEEDEKLNEESESEQGKIGKLWQDIIDRTKSSSLLVIIANVFYTILFIICLFVINFEQLPPIFNLYFIALLLPLWIILHSIPMLARCRSRFSTLIWRPRHIMSACTYSIATIAIASLLDYPMSISCIFFLFLLWCLFDDQRERSNLLVCNWILTALPLTIIPLQSTSEPFDPVLYMMSATAWFSSSIFFTIYNKARNWDLFYLLFGLFLLSASVGNVYKVQMQEDPGGSITSSVISWDLLASSPVLPILGSSVVGTKLLQVGVFMSIPFFLLSTTLEPLVLLLFIIHLSFWLYMEKPRFFTERIPIRLSNFNSLKSKVPAEDFRCSALYFVYSLMLFKSIGLPSSLTSSVLWTKPFSNISLSLPFLALKLLIALIPVTCIFTTYLRLTCSSTVSFLKLTLLFLSFIPLIAIIRFSFYTNHSWKELSLTHYYIGNFLYLSFVLILFPLSYFYTGRSLVQKYQREAVNVPPN